MALWLLRIDAEQDLVTLTYFEKNKPPKDCGRGGLAFLSGIESWVIEQATPFDRIQTSHGTFVRQVSALVAA